MPVLLLAWCLIVLVGLSIPETRKIRYILPIVPPLAGLAACVFVNDQQKWLRWLRRLTEFILGFLPLFAAIFIFTQKKKISASALDPNFYLAVLLVLFLIGAGSAFFFLKRKLSPSMPLLASAILTLCFLQIGVVEPIDLRLHDTTKFVRHVEALREKNPGKLFFYNENPDGLPIKYVVNMKTNAYPQFTRELEALKKVRSPIWLLTKEKNRDDLKKAGLNDSQIVSREPFGGSVFLILFIPADSSFFESSR